MSIRNDIMHESKQFGTSKLTNIFVSNLCLMILLKVFDLDIILYYIKIFFLSNKTLHFLKSDAIY